MFRTALIVMTKIQITDQHRIREIIAVIITGLGKFVFMDWLNWRLPYITVAIVFWIGYIFYQKNKDSNILSYWGLTTRNFKQTFLELLPLAILSILLFIFLGNKMGTNILNQDILPLLLIYPLWGIIQQFIMIGILSKNLKTLNQIKIPDYLIVLITAMVFAVVHFPFLLLVIGTFFLAMVYTILYLHDRNLIVMGIYHGWIGAFFFYTILERNPWREVFG